MAGIHPFEQRSKLHSARVQCSVCGGDWSSIQNHWYDTVTLHFEGGPQAPTSYAFVLWFMHVPLQGDRLEVAGCKRIKYEVLPRSSVRSSEGAYKDHLIHLSSIVCRQHVVPDFKSKDTFYVSAFSSTRPL